MIIFEETILGKDSRGFVTAIVNVDFRILCVF